MAVKRHPGEIWVVDARTDLDDFWALRWPEMVGVELVHTPILAISKGDGPGPVTTVTIIQQAEALRALPDNTVILMQWPGRWRSDWFTTTVRECVKRLPGATW